MRNIDILGILYCNRYIVPLRGDTTNRREHMYNAVNGELSQKARKWVVVAAYAVAVLMVAMAVFTAFTDYAAHPIGAAIAMATIGGAACYIGRQIATNRPL